MSTRCCKKRRHCVVIISGLAPIGPDDLVKETENKRDKRGEWKIKERIRYTMSNRGKIGVAPSTFGEGFASEK